MSLPAISGALNSPPSRKRTHDQITRSESPSSSPEQASKRRRVQISPSPSPLPRPLSPPPRYHGDGFDYRRPIMNARRQSTIDLTADDDDELPSPPAELAAEIEADFLRYMADHPTPDNEVYAALSPPPPDPPRRAQHFEVIDISDDEDDGVEDAQVRVEEPDPRQRRDSSSSEIIVLREQQVAQPRPVQQSRRPSLRDRRPTPGPGIARDPPVLEAPPPLPTFGNIPAFIRRGGQAFINNMAPMLQPYLQRPRNPFEPPVLEEDGGDLEIIMDYGQAAFNLGGRESEPPHATPGPAYKEPPPVPTGFSADLDENGVYVCPRCHQELATGSEEKQQIWVVKQCGHVYCGACARSRNIRSGTKKDKKKAKSANQADDFKACMIDDCKGRVDTKDAMIHVFL